MSDAVSKLTLGRAKSAVLARDFTLAENLFKSLLEKEPENIELLGELGGLYQKTGQDEDALALYQQILEIDDKNLMAMNSLGSIYRKLKRYRDSVAILEQGIIVDEHNIQLFYNLGFTYKEMEKYPGAIHCFEMVIAHNKDDVLAYNHLGSIYSLQGDFSKAIETLNRGVKIDPNHPVLHLNLAHCYEKVGNVDAASLEYEAALRSKPGWFEAIDGYADLLLSKDNAVHAQDLVGQALSLHPESAGMHTKMGHVYTQLDSLSEAQSQYNEALSLEPENTDALSGLADAYEADGKVLEALQTMETYEKLSPGDMDMLRQYTHILLTGNKLAAAYEKIHKVFEKNPEDVKTLNLMGQYYICSGDDDRADECFQQIRSIDPSYVAYYKDGAMRYDQMGNHVKAEKGLKKYLDVRPYDSRALSMLASNYESQERYEDAQVIYSGLAEKHGGNPSYKQKLDKLNKKIPVAAPQEIAFAPEEGAESAALSSDGMDRPLDSEQTEIAGSTEAAENAAVAGEEKHDLGYNLEELTENDENASPFERKLDDEIEASRSDDNSLDALISEEDKLEQAVEDAEDDFFKENPFGNAPAPQRELPEEDDRMFQSEELDDGADKEEQPVSLDEDIPAEDDDEDEDVGFQLAEPEPEAEEDIAPEPESLPEAEEEVAEEPEEIEPEAEEAETLEELSEEAEGEETLDEPEELSDDADELVPLEEAEEIPEADEEIETLDEIAEAEELAEAEAEILPGDEELAEVEAEAAPEELPEAEDAEGLEPESEELEPESEEEELVPEPEELELEPEDMEAASPEEPKDLPPAESDIEEPDVVEDVTEFDSFLKDDEKDELAMELSEIEDAITDRSAAEKYKKTADMFRQLRELAEYLPEDKKAEFLRGEDRLKLEWVISRLEGKPGLMAVSEAWRKDFDLESPFSEPEAAKENHGMELVRYVLDHMKGIIGSMGDLYLAGCLGSKVESLIAKLDS